MERLPLGNMRCHLDVMTRLSLMVMLRHFAAKLLSFITV